MSTEKILKRFRKEIIELNEALSELKNEIRDGEKNIVISAFLNTQNAKILLKNLRKEEKE